MKPVVLSLVFAIAGLATPAAAAADVIVQPDWLRKPTQEQLMAVWPKGALQVGKKGRGVIDCSVSLQGMLFDCKVAEEDPVGSGFGGAAIALTPQFVMKPATRNGVPFVATHVRIPITFVWPAEMRRQGHIFTNEVIANVNWRAAPSFAQVVAAYPAKARAAGAGGSATLDCRFKDDGLLSDCSVLGQTPTGMGFGEAAKSLSSLFVGPTALKDGSLTKGASVQIPVTFAPEMLTSNKPVTGKPKWTAVPSAEDLVGAIPPAAIAAGAKTARVMISCVIAQGGGITDCAVVSEDPPNLGFGAATLGLAKGVRVSIWTAEGLPTIGGGVSVPIRYDIPPPAPAAPPAKP